MDGSKAFARTRRAAAAERTCLGGALRGRVSSIHTRTFLLAALLAVPALLAAVPTAAASASSESCVLLYELADVRRHYACVDPKAGCPAYTKTVSWSGTTRSCLVPQATQTNEACGAACIEECRVVVTSGSVLAGCTIAHHPYYAETDCFTPVGCEWTIADCNTQSAGLCVGEQAPPVERCQMLVTGFELDTGVCVDSDAECKAWVDHRFRPICVVGPIGTA